MWRASLKSPYFTCDTCSLAHSATIMLLVMLTLNLVLMVLSDSRKRTVVVAQELTIGL